jgi:hypothetical protein
LFEQRTEDRGVDLTPIGLRRLKQFADLLAWQAERRSVLEQIAVELLHVAFEREGEAASIHRFPQLADESREEFVVSDAFAEDFAKAPLRQ